MNPEEYDRVLRNNASWTVREELPTVRAPAFVMHRPECMAPTQGPELALALPNAELAVFQGKGLMPYVGFADDEVAVMKEFLGKVFPR